MRDWLWDWKIAKPYFVIAGIGVALKLLVILLDKIGWIS